MKKKQRYVPIILKSLFVAVLFPFHSCHKGDSTDNRNCGCENETFTTVVKIEGSLSYIVNNNQKEWYVSTPQDGAFSIAVLAKVCNPQSAYVRAITDTLSSTGTPVLFSGKLKQICGSDADDFGTVLANTALYFITIDSLTKKD